MLQFAICSPFSLARHALLLVILTVTGTPANASDLFPPFRVANTNPFMQIFGLPGAQSSRVMVSGEATTSFDFTVTNNAITVNNETETLTLDGESYTSSLRLRYGMATGFEVGFVLPYTAHRNGIFDPFIEGWHDVFGLSNTQRHQLRRNVLNYRYRRDGEELLDLSQPKNGIGDIRVFTSTQLLENTATGRLAAFYAEVKLPTGESESLQGSGAPDFSFSLNASNRYLKSSVDVTLFYHLGLTRLGSSDIFSEFQKTWVPFGGVGFGVPIWSRLVLVAQVDAHGPIYRSSLEQLGHTAVQLTVGGVAQISQRTELSIALGENLVTDPIPDFILLFSLSHRL